MFLIRAGGEFVTNWCSSLRLVVSFFAQVGKIRVCSLLTVILRVSLPNTRLIPTIFRSPLNMTPFRLFTPTTPLPFLPFAPTAANLPFQLHLAAWNALRLRQQQNQIQALEVARQNAKTESMDESEIEVVVDDDVQEEERKCKSFWENLKTTCTFY